MTIYCDTSVMVALLSAEANSELVATWLEAVRAEIAISHWVMTEFSAALAMKRRMGAVQPDHWDDIMASWRGLCRSEMDIVPVRESDFLGAARLAERQDIAVRSGDALHLSIATARGFSLATLDVKFAAAARAVGARVESPVAAT